MIKTNCHGCDIMRRSKCDGIGSSYIEVDDGFGTSKKIWEVSALPNRE